MSPRILQTQKTTNVCLPKKKKTTNIRVLSNSIQRKDQNKMSSNNDDTNNVPAPAAAVAADVDPIVEQGLWVDGIYRTSNMNISFPSIIPADQLSILNAFIRDLVDVQISASASLTTTNNPPVTNVRWYIAYLLQKKYVKEVAESTWSNNCIKTYSDITKSPPKKTSLVTIIPNLTDVEPGLFSRMLPYLSAQDLLNLDIATYHIGFTNEIWFQILNSRYLPHQIEEDTELIRLLGHHLKHWGKGTFLVIPRLLLLNCAAQSNLGTIQFIDKSGNVGRPYLSDGDDVAPENVVQPMLLSELPSPSMTWTSNTPILTHTDDILAYLDCYYIGGNEPPVKIFSQKLQCEETIENAIDISDLFNDGNPWLQVCLPYGETNVIDWDTPNWDIPTTLGQLYDRLGNDIFRDNGTATRTDPRIHRPFFLEGKDFIKFKLRLFRRDTGQSITWNYDARQNDMLKQDGGRLQFTTECYTRDGIKLGAVAQLDHEIRFQIEPIPAPEGATVVPEGGQLTFNEDDGMPQSDDTDWSKDTTRYRIIQNGESGFDFSLTVKPTETQPPNTPFMVLNGLHWK